ncbi:NAD-dependent epimerase/dehydratase family protein [Fictibacillus nanhaiensis]|uniref:NAD-dependent epimerase/dehydratase family protein n=1 Tax=Fictibacillus nanhaiensis TaxID=742169 RepID=UPI001C96B7D0|nr:NAD-dependent epimerase/dehydratase family protein [Fictibacillus nanhaiensis]MBY6035890.1 NAD-dependent epimerase/dehydratase family protein [Fictibacillus nanhaiensis]
MHKKKVIVAGSSGLIGREVIKQLIINPAYEEIIVLVRKPSSLKSSKVREIIFDFSSAEYELEPIQAESMLICIGTTMKKAKTKEAFKEVDLHIPVKLAKLAKKLNIHNVSVISALGAHSQSSFFYNRVKGEMESQLISVNLPSLSILRPSLLMGDREEFRLGEKLAEKLYQTLPFVYPKKYQPIEASHVAKVMIKESSRHQKNNINIIENPMIRELSRNS